MMKEILLALHQQPIAVYPIYIDITGSMTSGVLLSQIMYWNSKMKGVEFYKSDAELMQETRLTQSEFKTAKKLISQLSFLKIEKKGAPYRTYYSVNTDELLVVLRRFSSSFTYQLGSRLPTSQRGVNLRTIIGTENTQEITTEITTEVEINSTGLIEENEEMKMEVHHVPDYQNDEVEKIEQEIYSSKINQREKRKNVAQKKKGSNPNKAPVDEMYKMYAEAFKRVSGGETPVAQKKDFVALASIHKTLLERAKEKDKDFIPKTPTDLWKVFLDKTETLVKNPKEAWLHDNFTPSVFWSQFNTILVKIKNPAPQKPIIPLYREEGYSKSNVLF